jgi:hypothetical protein
MIQADLDRSERLLSVQYAGRVGAVEMNASLERLKELLKDVEPGLRVLADLSNLESMDASCAPIIGVLMDFLVEKKIASVVRVNPDPQKDIGFALMSHIHYGREVRTTTCDNLKKAQEHLAR